MTKPEPQDPPERALRRWTGTPLLGGTTSQERPGSEATRSASAEPTGLAAPLLPRGARRPAAIAAACCAVVVAVLGALAADRSTGNAVDRPVDAWLLHHLGSHLRVLSDISYIGGGQVTAGLTVLLVAACLFARRLNGALLTLVSIVAAAGLTEYALKPLVHETIHHGWLTYPSGHMTSLCTIMAVTWVLLLNPPHRRLRPALRLLLLAGLLIVAGIVAIALVVLTYHYFTDTIAGAAWGIGVTIATTFLLDSTSVRRLLGRPRRVSGS
jgi:undecaprenyl-diphosphatase